MQSLRHRAWPCMSSLLHAHHPLIGAIGVGLTVGIAYFAAARFGLALLTAPDGVAVFWPAAGISAGALIALGPGARFPVVAGTIGATIVANLLGDRNLAATIIFALSNAAEALITAWLIHRHYRDAFSLDALRRVLRLFAAAVIASAVSGFRRHYWVCAVPRLRCIGRDHVVQLVHFRCAWHHHDRPAGDWVGLNRARAAIAK